MAIAIERQRNGAPHAAIARAMALATVGVLAGAVLAALLMAVIATRFFDFGLLTVRSDSMAPAITSGDLIVVKPVPIADIAAGDVILFASGGDAIPTVHRVAGVNTVEIHIRDASGAITETLTEHRLVTQGDANPLPDASEVTVENLRGEVWFTVPNGGAVTGMPLQFALMVFAAVVTTAWIGWELNRKRVRS